MESTQETTRDNNLSNSEGAGDSSSEIIIPIKKTNSLKYTFDEHMWDKLPEIQQHS